MDFDLSFLDDDNVEKTARKRKKLCNGTDSKKKKIEKKATEILNKWENPIPENENNFDIIDDLSVKGNPLDDLDFKELKVENCIHEVVFPKNQEYQPLKPRWTKPSKLFPFKLDSFQNQAIQCIENNQTVLVSAHTSAGKTVCADYTIQMCLNSNRRVIYTTPIKALSNQKYRDFLKAYKDVGLMTGDVTINESGSVLIMTTEILRMMLYKNHSIIKEVGWIIFDEIHYMRDKERGYVWEESIIYIPRNLRMVLLSATIPNARQFAQWISYIHKQPCNIVYTEFRPTPLRHNIFPVCDDKIYNIIDTKGKFNSKAFSEAMTNLRKYETIKLNNGVKSTDESKVKNKENFCNIIENLNFDGKIPLIVFSFSRQKCEDYADLISKLKLGAHDNKAKIHKIFEKAISTLSVKDRELPQVDEMLRHLLNGVGIHHAGLLPVLKEVVEIIFGAGLIPVLFATDTFAMGLNMPAKCVLFTSIKKFDGDKSRIITGGEYIQMSGRAGRRGLDSYGEVIVMLENDLDEDQLKAIFKGSTEPLNSSFQLTYNMMLNLMMTGAKNEDKIDITPQFVMERSFKQFQAYSTLPQLYDDLKTTNELIDNIDIDQKYINIIKSYNEKKYEIISIRQNIWKDIKAPKIYSKLLNIGSIIKIKNNNHDYSWCLCLSKLNYSSVVNSHIIKCLVPVSNSCISYAIELSMCQPNESYVVGNFDQKEDIKCLIIDIDWKCIDEVTSETLSMSITEANNIISYPLLRKEWLKKLIDKLNENNNELALLNMKTFDNGENESWIKNIKKLRKKEKKIQSHELNSCDNKIELLSKYNEMKMYEKQRESIKKQIRDRLELIKLHELKVRENILTKFGLLDQTNMVTMKGRVAANIMNGDCLVLTELLFNAEFGNLTSEQLVGLLTSFVYQGFGNKTSNNKTNSKSDKSTCTTVSNKISADEKIVKKMDIIFEHARYIGKISKEFGLYINEERYVSNFSTELIEAMRAWALGADFKLISQHHLCGGAHNNYVGFNTKSSIPDGHLIRSFKRVAELLVELGDASKIMSSADFERIFSQAILKIKRGIVFASSLYTEKNQLLFEK